MLLASVVGNWTVNGLPGPIHSLISGEGEAAPASPDPSPSGEQG